jgi:YNFM family putative membrane transporter
LLASFGIGFCILFAFIGTFTYINFVLVREPLLLGRMALGFVYFVFLPSILTTPFAGAAARRFGTRPTIWCALALAGLGLMLVGIGTFFAQATATGFVGQAATADRGSASGIYLACYFFGGLVGTVVLGQIFDLFGWWACVVGIGFALATAAYLAIHLRLRCDESTA